MCNAISSLNPKTLCLSRSPTTPKLVKAPESVLHIARAMRATMQQCLCFLGAKSNTAQIFVRRTREEGHGQRKRRQQKWRGGGKVVGKVRACALAQHVIRARFYTVRSLARFCGKEITLQRSLISASQTPLRGGVNGVNKCYVPLPFPPFDHSFAATFLFRPLFCANVCLFRAHCNYCIAISLSLSLTQRHCFGLCFG